MEITESGNELQLWLASKKQYRGHWAASLATRIALRALPIALEDAGKQKWQIELALMAFRCAVLAWGSTVFPSTKMRKACFAASEAALGAFKRRPDGEEAADASTFALFAVERAAYAASTAVSNVDDSIQAASACAKQSNFFMKGLLESGPVKSLLDDALDYDCELLENSSYPHKAAKELLLRSLWEFGKPNAWSRSWEISRNKLLAADEDRSFLVWLEWFDRISIGFIEAFEIPGDVDQKENKAILYQLASESDKFFWDKGAIFVNNRLQRWIDDAQARCSQPVSFEAGQTIEIDGLPAAKFGPAPVPSQNRNVLSFKATSEGRIAIDAIAMAGHMRTDQDAQDRYAEAVSEARLAFDRCQTSNAGARLTRLLQNYLAATGDALEQAKPSLIVQRGERLRQELTAYENPDSFLDPIADDLRNDLIGWRTAHNMMVGLDPVLNAADLAMLGPDSQPALIPPDEITEKVRQADEAGLIETGDAEIVIEGIALAPMPPDLNDRRTIWSVEVIRNLFSESIGIALNPSNADAQASGLIIVSGFRAACGSIDHAKYIVENREWILDRLGSTPTWRELIGILASRLEAITPFDPK